MRTCPKCGSTKIYTEKRPNGRITCRDCGAFLGTLGGFKESADPEAVKRYDSLAKFVRGLGYSLETSQIYASRLQAKCEPGNASYRKLADVSYSFNVKDPVGEAKKIAEYINSGSMRESFNRFAESLGVFDTIEENVIDEEDAFDFGYDPRLLNEAMRTLIKAKYKIIRG